MCARCGVVQEVTSKLDLLATLLCLIRVGFVDSISTIHMRLVPQRPFVYDLDLSDRVIYLNCMHGVQ
jgi:hypothetical protein